MLENQEARESEWQKHIENARNVERLKTTDPEHQKVDESKNQTIIQQGAREPERQRAKEPECYRTKANCVTPNCQSAENHSARNSAPENHIARTPEKPREPERHTVRSRCHRIRESGIQRAICMVLWVIS